MSNDYMEHAVHEDNVKLCDELTVLDAENPFQEHLVNRKVMTGLDRHVYCMWKPDRIVGANKNRYLLMGDKAVKTKAHYPHQMTPLSVQSA
jgi:hypothetical protein